MIYKCLGLRCLDLLQNPSRFSGRTWQAFSQIHLEMQRAKDMQDTLEEDLLFRISGPDRATCP